MPNPVENETQEEFVERCIPMVIEDGTAENPEQAAAICVSMWEENATKKERHFVAIKALDDWQLDVLGVPFGGPNAGKDTHGQFFDNRTKLHEDIFPLPPVVYYHGDNPDGSLQDEPEIIGKTIERRVSTDGVWYRVVLDKASAFARRVWQAAKDGLARASSGSIAHLVRIGPDGHIANWAVVELSLFDIGEGRQPANGYAVALPAMKAIYKRAGIALPDFAVVSTKGEIEMDEKQINDVVAASVAAALKAQQDAQAAEAALKSQEQERIDAAVNAAKTAWETEAAKGRRLPTVDGAPYAAKFADISKFDDLDPDSHALMACVLQSAKASGQSKRGVSAESMKSLVIKLGESKEEYHLPAKRGMKAAGIPMDGMAVKANELNYSTYDAYGDDWVHTLFSSRLWEKIRLGTSIVSNLPTVVVPQGAESITIPIQGASMSFYKVAQATAQDANPGPTTRTVTTSKMGTPDNQVLSVVKLGGGATYTGELEEDSIIPWAATLRADSEKEAEEVLESLVIDGDTDATASTNINDIAGTPASTDYFLVMNGFRKLALVTNTANSRAGGSLTVDDFTDTIKLMGLAGKNAFQKDKVAFIMDAWTSWKVLGLPEILTKDVFSAPTIENGSLTGLWGYKVIASPHMHRPNQDATYGLKANSAGKLDLDTAANNLYGSLLAVRWDQWQFGYKRRITFETQRIPRADATEITVLMRVGLIYRDTEASAITYGLSI